MNHHHTSFTALPPAPGPLGAQSSGSRIDAPLYQWPTGDVKLECTFGQEPAGWDDEGWKWRSSGSRKKGVPESATHVDKRTCLGVFHCGCIDERGVPTRFFRPRSAVDARQKQETETCHICRSTLKPVKCAATLTYYRVVDDDGRVKAVRHHVGHHDHARPPLTKLSATEVEALDVQVRQNPEATAQQLRAGAGITQVALGEINPILLNPRKARHEVEKSKVRQDLIPASTRNSGFQLLESFSALNNSFESPWIVASNLLEQQYICMQTPFMRDVLLREDSVQSWHAENLEPESGRHGVITDGTHDFFKHGILLTSLVFSQVLFRWVVVLYTWIGNQDQEHHLPHFKQLVEVIAEICTSGLGFSFDDRVFSAILDFSNAQRNGFIDAFVDYMCSRIPGWKELSPKSRASERTTLRARAQALLIGCKVHWRRSTHKIKQVIAIQFQYRFEQLIAILEGESTTPSQFLQAVSDIHREFPEVRPWLAWWILPGNGGMIFPAMQRMPAELRAQLPSSTNGAESAHNLLYNAAGRNHDILEGVRRLYRVSRETEMLYDAVTAGHVQARFQGLRPQLTSRITPTWYENDGRAPDTRERLAAVAKLEADLAAQKSSLNETERFLAANTTSKSVAGSGAAAPSSEGSADRRLLQSYKWDANSCFIDAPLEAIFRAFTAMSDAVRGELLRRIRRECPPKSGLRDVFEHFWLRGLLSGAISTPEPLAKKETPKSLHNKLITALDAGQRNVKRLIQTRWDGGEFVAGMPGCARTWPNQMVQMDTTPRLQQYFGVHYRLKYVCGSNHVTETLHPQVYYEFPIYRDDLALAQGYIQPGADQPSLADLLVHSIPRDRYGPRHGRSAAFIPQVESSTTCPHLPCSNSHSSLISISTEWPLILRVSPNFARVEGADETFRDVSCPLIMKVGPDVEYELISRVIYSGSMAAGAVGHYTTQLRIGNNTYIYNDLLRDGALAYLGPLQLLEEFHPQTMFVIYLRRSRAEVSGLNPSYRTD
ncbi:hypothetical protein FB451DRAFT_1041007 [Mycena latifolia]|nr:hypothetical protein FB451DRAFT_1041007 [Mycena latifolia]